MGIIRAQKPITDTNIPAEIARDAEFAAADAAHVATADPHPIYLNQAEGDARYPQFKRNIYTLITGSAQGSLTSRGHGLDATKIQSVAALVFVSPIVIKPGSASRILPGGVAGLEGYHYSVNIDSGNILCRLHPTDSSRILNCTVSVVIDWL